MVMFSFIKVKSNPDFQFPNPDVPYPHNHPEPTKRHVRYCTFLRFSQALDIKCFIIVQYDNAVYISPLHIQMLSILSYQ